jgi:hydroxyacylglutathione hydrolase
VPDRADPSRLYLRQLEVGPMQNFVYLVGDRDKREAVVVDAAWDIDGILAVAERDDMRVTAGLVTHFHPDHLGGSMMGMEIQGAADLIARLPVKIHIHKSEGPYAKKIAGLSDSDMTLNEAGDTLRVGDVDVRFLHTPGHTPGSQCFLVDGNLVSGDTLFIGACGRVDLPGSSPEDLYHSLNNTLKRLPAETVLHPGHNYASRTTSTIGDEARTNPYLRFDRLDEFLRIMGY